MNDKEEIRMVGAAPGTERPVPEDQLTPEEKRVNDIIEAKLYEVVERHKDNPNIDYEDIFYETIGRISVDSGARLVYGKDYIQKNITWTMIINEVTVPNSEFESVYAWASDRGLIW